MTYMVVWVWQLQYINSINHIRIRRVIPSILNCCGKFIIMVTKLC